MNAEYDPKRMVCQDNIETFKRLMKKNALGGLKEIKKWFI
jgi:hypothetical protein